MDSEAWKMPPAARQPAHDWVGLRAVKRLMQVVCRTKCPNNVRKVADESNEPQRGLNKSCDSQEGYRPM